MIEKLEPLQGLDHSWLNKINELVDTVNKQERTIKLLIDGLEKFAQSQQETTLEIEYKEQ